MTILELFEPCRRGRDHYFLRNAFPESCSEAQLIAGRTEEFLEGRHTWEDLLQLLHLHDTIWLSGTVLISLDYRYSAFRKKLPFTTYHLKIESENEQASRRSIYLASLFKRIEPTRLLKKIVGLMAQERPIAVELGPLGMLGDFPLSADSLAYVLDVNQSNLKRLKIHNTCLSEAHCRILGSFRGSLSIDRCPLEEDGTSLVSEIEKGRGPTALELRDCIGPHIQINASSDQCIRLVDIDVDAQALYGALSSTRSLREFSLRVDANLRSFSLPQLLNTIGKNIGLVKFSLDFSRGSVLRGREWEDAFRSLLLHPTLEEVSFVCFPEVQVEENTDQDKVRRASIVVGALKRNEVLRRLCVCDPYGRQDIYEQDILDATIFEEQIQPRLTANDYRARLKTLAKTETDQPLRLALFSRALVRPVINPDASLVWALLSGFRTELVALLKTSSVAVEAMVEDTDEVSETQQKSRKQRIGKDD